MTFEEKLKELLVERGMIENLAQTIIDRMKADKDNKDMEECWNHKVEYYPPQMLTILWWRTKKATLVYIDEVCPKAFNRQMFV